MTSTEAKYKLTYFNARGGGEIIRLIFAVGNAAYEDERIEKEAWPMRKSGRISVVYPVLCLMIMGGFQRVWVGGGGRGSGHPPSLKKHKHIGLQSNTVPDPLKNHKATKPAVNVWTSSSRQRNAI